MHCSAILRSPQEVATVAAPSTALADALKSAVAARVALGPAKLLRLALRVVGAMVTAPVKLPLLDVRRLRPSMSSPPRMAET